LNHALISLLVLCKIPKGMGRKKMRVGMGCGG